MLRVSATACTDIQTGCTFEDRSTSAPTSPLSPTVTDNASETQIGSDGQAQSYLQSSFGPGPSLDQTIITANGTGRYFASTEDGEGASAEAGFLSLFDVLFQLETSYSYSLSLDLLASGSPTLVEFCFGPVAGGCLESLALGSPYPNGSSLSINVNGVLGAGDYRLVLQALGGSFDGTALVQDGGAIAGDGTFDLDLDLIRQGSIPDPAVVPEPSSMLLLGSGVAALLGKRAATRKRRIVVPDGPLPGSQ